MRKTGKTQSRNELASMSLDDFLSGAFEKVETLVDGPGEETAAKRRRESSEATGTGRAVTPKKSAKRSRLDADAGGAACACVLPVPLLSSVPKRRPARASPVTSSGSLVSPTSASVSVSVSADPSPPVAAHPSSAARVARADVATPGGGGGFQLFAKPKTDRTKGKQPAAAAAATTVAAAAAGVSAQKGKAAHGDVAAAVAAESRALGSTKNAGERSRSKASHTASAAAAADDDDSEEGLERAGTQLLAPMGQAQASLVGFKSLGLNDWLVGNLKAVNISAPTPVQAACIPKVMAGSDVIGTAQTGSGKTAAFALPILQLLAEDPYGIFALVLTPTRELAFQICDQFVAFGAGMTLHVLVVVGGEDMRRQASALARRPHVVVGTPGRLVDHLRSDPGLSAALRRVRFLVLDEADRLLEPAMEPELEAISEALPRQGRQTLLFSATITRGIAALQEVTLRKAFHFEAYEGLRTADNLRQKFLLVPAKVKEVYLAFLMQAEQLAARKVRSVLVFCGTVRACQLLGDMLRELGVDSAVLHSAKAQKYRLAELDKFRSRRVPILIATDVASRGLDIPSVDMVVNADVPSAPEDYVHRTGRTARAGRGGLAVTLVTQYDVERVKTIEKHVGKEMEALDGVDEADVLKNITAVFNARRTAALRMAEPGGFDAQLAERKKKLRAAKGGAGGGGPAAR